MPTLILMVEKAVFLSHGNSEPHPFRKKKILDLRVPTARKRSLNIRLEAKGFFII